MCPCWGSVWIRLYMVERQRKSVVVDRHVVQLLVHAVVPPVHAFQGLAQLIRLALLWRGVVVVATAATAAATAAAAAAATTAAATVMATATTTATTTASWFQMFSPVVTSSATTAATTSATAVLSFSRKA